MARYLDEVCEQAYTEKDRPKYKPVGNVSLADGIKEILEGTWTGVGILETLDGWTHLFGKRVIVADRDREGLRKQFPDLLIFSPDDFKWIVEDWPKSEMIVYALRQFDGELT